MASPSPDIDSHDVIDARIDPELARRIDEWVEANADAMLAFAARLIQTPSENRPPNGDEHEAQLLLKKELEAQGAEVDWFEVTDVPQITEHPAFMAGRNYEGRPNVVGRFRGRGGGRSLLFSSHMDTAPREPLPWRHTEPFSGELKDGKLWGRGSFDMKGGLVASLWAAYGARAVCPDLRGDILIESVVDEEWGGANGTLAARLRGHQADAAILPEPTGLQVCPEHLGAHLYRLTVPGSAGMVFGNPHLQNPIYTAIRFVEALQAWEKEFHARPSPPLFEGVAKPPVMVTAIEARQYGIPRTCVVDFAVSFYKDDDPDAIHDAIVALIDKAFEGIDFGEESVQLERLYRLLPGSGVPADHPIVQTVQGAFASAPDLKCEVKGVPFQCDAFMFNLYSPTPAIIMGPDGAGAHSSDEYATVDSLINLLRIYIRTIVAWCA